MRGLHFAHAVDAQGNLLGIGNRDVSLQKSSCPMTEM